MAFVVEMDLLTAFSGVAFPYGLYHMGRDFGCGVTRKGEVAETPEIVGTVFRVDFFTLKNLGKAGLQLALGFVGDRFSILLFL